MLHKEDAHSTAQSEVLIHATIIKSTLSTKKKHYSFKDILKSELGYYSFRISMRDISYVNHIYRFISIAYLLLVLVINIKKFNEEG